MFLVMLSCVIYIVKSSSRFSAANVSYLILCIGRFDVVLWRK